MAMRQIEKMLKDMQSEGKDLARLKLKKFQKTHHIDCKCKLCEEAKKKNDPHMRGLIEDGFKVYVDGDKKADWNQLLSTLFFAWLREFSFLPVVCSIIVIINNKHHFPALVNWHLGIMLRTIISF